MPSDFFIWWQCVHFLHCLITYSNAQKEAGGQRPLKAGPPGCWPMTVKTWTGIVLIRCCSHNVENPASVWALYRRAWGMINLQSFEWHKNMGLKYNTLPLVNRSPRLPFAFSFPSQHLCLILLSLQFPHLLSHILSWSFCPQFLSFIFHLQTNCLDSYTPNPSFFLFSFFLSSHFCIHSTTWLVLLSCPNSQQRL